MADHSATLLGEIVIYGVESRHIGRLAEQLAADPPLLLWAVCLAGQDALRPGSVGEIAQWLAPRTLEVLQWETGREGHFTPAADDPAADDGSRASRYAEWVAESLAIADLAGLLTAGQSPRTAEKAVLLGLLHEAGRWLALSGDGPAAAVEKVAAEGCLPDWLRGGYHAAAAEVVSQAVAVLAGESAAGVVDVDAQKCCRRADHGRRRWLESIPGVAARLPELTARLARLEKLENEFEKTLETEKLEAMAEFAAGAGHEINNPLAVIAGRAQLFLQDEEDPERRRGLALMNAQAKRVYEMIADMRLFARPPQPAPEPVELVEFVDRVVEELSVQAAERGVTLCRVGTTERLMIEVDPTQLNVALRAMCKNSLEAIGHDGRIEIGLSGLDDEVEIRVRDDGPGIPDDVRRHLFDPFYSARPAGRGLGLGLSKCWRIVVTNHGGRIEVESQADRGTTFTIILPRRKGER